MSQRLVASAERSIRSASSWRAVKVCAAFVSAVFNKMTGGPPRSQRETPRISPTSMADPEHEHPEHLDGRDPALEGFVFGIPGALVFRPNPKGIPNQATSAFDFLGISQGREGEYRNT